MQSANGPARFRHAAGWILLGQIGYQLAQFGVLSALSLKSGPETVGAFALSLALSAPVVMLTNFDLRAALATDARGEFQFSEYARLRFRSLTVAAILMLFVGVIFFAGHPENLPLYALICLAKLVESYSDLWYGLFQKHEKMHLVARSLLLRGPLTLMGFVVVLGMGYSPILAFGVQLVIWSAVAVFHDRRCGWRLVGATDEAPRAGSTLRLLRLVWPLGLNSVAASLTNTMPRLIVKLHFGLAMAGYFSAVSYVLYGGMFFANAIGTVLAPRLSRLWEASDYNSFHRLTLSAVGIAALMGLLGTVLAATIGGWFLATAFGPNYAAYTAEFTITCAALGLRAVAVAIQTAIFAQRRFHSIGWTQTSSLVLTTLLVVVATPIWGMVGALCAIAADTMVQIVIFGVVLRRARRRDVPTISPRGNRR